MYCRVEDNRIKLFISHSWRDKSLAEQLAKPLGDFCDVWLDYRKLRPGDVIQEEIDPALLESDLVLLVWSATIRRWSKTQGWRWLRNSIAG